jgi:hypothetical protein
LEFTNTSIIEIKNIYRKSREIAYKLDDREHLDFCLRELQEVFEDEIEMFSENPSDEWYFDSAKSELLAVLNDCKKGHL